MDKVSGIFLSLFAKRVDYAVDGEIPRAGGGIEMILFDQIEVEEFFVADCFNGVFLSLARPVALEMDPNPIGAPGTMSFTDDYSLTGGSPANGMRFFRVEVVR